MADFSGSKVLSFGGGDQLFAREPGVELIEDDGDDDDGADDDLAVVLIDAEDDDAAIDHLDDERAK